ncbi:2-dehydro-3-deoxygalactonokinase [Gallibacterium genomosp. 1]|uniref:2-dehydro-3-deoxygalactonokinase n=1 Tax=Gallibacterium genomosp. 1 TaxID=155515 RepID=UPI0009F4B770|nr:2-dehydro-3-deoxygalactonokinase [Gallibacterium genomosp. 1]
MKKKRKLLIKNGIFITEKCLFFDYYLVIQDNVIWWVMIAIDWGTTNFRAYYLSMNKDNKMLENNNKGVKFIEGDKFEDVILDLFKQHFFLYDLNNRFVGMSGMIGSKNGWIEVPYLYGSVNLEDIKKSLYSFTLSNGIPAFIVPGIAMINKYGIFDVMRGEETQLLGLYKMTKGDDLSVILPGTHSKHASIQFGKLVDFCTLMTGELFSLLDQYSILTKGMPSFYNDESAFLKGVEIGNEIPLSNALFSTRTLFLNQQISSNQVRSYLSGIIIGNEIRLLPKDLNHYVVGSENIVKRYTNALKYLGYRHQVVDGEHCFLAGIESMVSD